MAASPLPHCQSGRNAEYYQFTPQAPPSPPMEETKCSLPSISNLLGIADAGSPTSLISPDSASNSPRHDVFPSTRRQETPYTSIDSRPGSSYTKPLYQSRALPPTPPLGTDSSFDNYASPAGKYSRQHSNPQYMAGRYMKATPRPLDTIIRRHQVHPLSVHQTPRYLQSPPPQRTAPLSSFPGQPEPGRYCGSSNLIHGVTYPQRQDRYICPSCSKAFSRPSSLRLHSYSHTGEKPFKCPHAGCAKAFSVRSNMKRHERGCHTFNIDAG